MVGFYRFYFFHIRSDIPLQLFLLQPRRIPMFIQFHKIQKEIILLLNSRVQPLKQKGNAYKEIKNLVTPTIQTHLAWVIGYLKILLLMRHGWINRKGLVQHSKRREKEGLLERRSSLFYTRVGLPIS